MSNIIYAWNCLTVDCYPTKNEQGVELTDVVYNIYWCLTGTQEVGSNTYSASVMGTQEVTADDIDPNAFVPFAELTNEIATGWCTTAMGEEQIASLEASIVSQIEAQANPTSITLVIGQPIPTV